jgi:hypothetical protein
MRLRFFSAISCGVLIASVCLISISCTRKDSNAAKVAVAVRVFIDRFNAGKFGEIYATSDPRFQESVSEDQFSKKLAGLSQEHGAIQSAGVNGIEYMTRWQRLFPEAKPTRFIGYYFACRNAGFQGLFTFDVTGDEARLLSFETSIEDANRKLAN